MARSWLHLADEARRRVEFKPIPRRFLNLPASRIVFGPWVVYGRIWVIRAPPDTRLTQRSDNTQQTPV